MCNLRFAGEVAAASAIRTTTLQERDDLPDIVVTVGQTASKADHARLRNAIDDRGKNLAIRAAVPPLAVEQIRRIGVRRSN